jgi:hypothetical protein
MSETPNKPIVIDPLPPDVKQARRLGRRLRKALYLPGFGIAYLDHLIGQYKQSGKSLPIADGIVHRRNSNPEEISWGDLYSLERILVASLTEEEVKRSLWATRFRLKQIAGVEAFRAYEQSGAPAADAGVEQLRADLQRILELLHWYYSLLPLRNALRIDYIVNCIFWIIGYTVTLGLLFTASQYWHWDPCVGLFASVVYFGTIGGYVSSLRRLQDLQFGKGDPIVGIYGLKSAAYFMWLSPMLGAIFAVILVLLFVGGVLTGSVFPAFQTPESVNGLSEFVKGLSFVKPNDYALLLLWSFVAGFAERFVPDNLDKMIAGQKRDESRDGQ